MTLKMTSCKKLDNVFIYLTKNKCKHIQNLCLAYNYILKPNFIIETKIFLMIKAVYKSVLVQTGTALSRIAIAQLSLKFSMSLNSRNFGTSAQIDVRYRTGHVEPSEEGPPPVEELAEVDKQQNETSNKFSFPEKIPFQEKFPGFLFPGSSSSSSSSSSSLSSSLSPPPIFTLPRSSGANVTTIFTAVIYGWSK